MEKILNQDEIDALFRAARGKTPGTTPSRQVLPLNFRAASQASDADIRSVTTLQENFARHLSNSLGAYLRVIFDVALVSAEQLTYGEFLPRIPELTYVATFNVTGIDARAIAQVEIAIIFPIIDLLLGGRGRPEANLRDISEIEEHILETIIDFFIREASLVWEPFGVEFTFGQRQPQSEVVRLMGPRERVLAFGFEIRLPEMRGAFNVVLPAVIGNVLRKQRGAHQKKTDKSRSSVRLRELVLDCSFPVEMQVPGLSITTRRLLDLRPGDVLQFRREVNHPVSVVAAGIPLFAAQLGRKNTARAAYLQERFSAAAPTRKPEAQP
jgi:flagellar motor switch protein FliM